MSERNQEESLVATWASAQQKVLAGWLDLVQGTEGPSRMTAWNETVRAWQTAMQEALDAQARWLRGWTRRVQVTSGSPTDLRKNVQQAQVLLLRWTEAQQHLWQGWFHLVQHLLHTLRESGQAIIDAQTEWVRSWTKDLADR